MKFFK